MTPSSDPTGHARPASPAGSGQAPPAERAPAPRRCTRSGCRQPALATLTYVYAASTAVVGPLAVVAEPHTYDLCVAHARSLTAPRGWQLVRHDGEFTPPAAVDDLAALAEAVWAADPPTARRGAGRRTVSPPRPRGRGGHLRVIPPPG